MMSSLYIGSTGLKTHAQGMNVVSNNIANINTVGFKKSMMLYQDLLSETRPSGSNNITNRNQVGMGAAVGTVKNVFTQGGFETGSAVTDLSIEGIGFFGVKKDNAVHYTRAGNFRFNYEGELLDPAGWNILGYKKTANGWDNNPSPIVLDLDDANIALNPARASAKLNSILQLGNITDVSSDENNPNFALVSHYNGLEDPPLKSTQYSYAQPLSYYDSTGTKRSATLYVDGAGEYGGSRSMEFIIALDPEEDASGLAGTKSAGLLMSGNLIFNNLGDITNIMAYNPSGNDPANLSSWQAANFKDGHPVLNINATGSSPQSMELDFGVKLSGKAQPATAVEASNLTDKEFFQGDSGAIRSSSYINSKGKANSNIYQNSDGYPEGSLINIEISPSGVVSAKYTNNQAQDIYTLALYQFTSEDGLRREGANHFSATDDAGNIIAGRPGEENFGKVSPWSLETSNVDYAHEFTNLIITQRAFQSNSKVITTSDAMLQKAMEIKRV